MATYALRLRFSPAATLRHGLTLRDSSLLDSGLFSVSASLLAGSSEAAALTAQASVAVSTSEQVAITTQASLGATGQAAAHGVAVLTIIATLSATGQPVVPGKTVVADSSPNAILVGDTEGP